MERINQGRARRKADRQRRDGGQQHERFGNRAVGQGPYSAYPSQNTAQTEVGRSIGNERSQQTVNEPQRPFSQPPTDSRLSNTPKKSESSAADYGNEPGYRSRSENEGYGLGFYVRRFLPRGWK